MASFEWPPSGGGSGGVTSLNTLTGGLTLAAGSGISVTPSGGDTLTIAGTGSAFQAFAQRYVDPSGSDSTGDGSVTKPWQTISHALSSITDNASGKQYALNIAPSNYTENVVLKPYVYPTGQPLVQNTIDPGNLVNTVTVIGNFTIPDSTAGIISMCGITVAGDFHTYTTTTTATGPFLFKDCVFSGTNMVIGSSAVTNSYDLTLDNCFVGTTGTTAFYSLDYDIRNTTFSNNTPVSVYGGNGVLTNCNLSGQVWTFNDNSVPSAPTVTIFGGMGSTTSVAGPNFTYAGPNVAEIDCDSIFNPSSLVATSTGQWSVVYISNSPLLVSNANATLLGDRTEVLVTTGSSNRTITLPDPGLYSGRDITIIKIDSGSGHVLLSPNVSGAALSIVTQYGAITVASISALWLAKSRYLT